MTRPTENQQTVEALAERVRAEGVFMHSISETWSEAAQEYLIDASGDGSHKCPPDCEGCASRERRDAALRDLVAQADQTTTLLRRIRQWDALNPPPDPVPAPFGDITYWIAEIDRMLARLDGAR